MDGWKTSFLLEWPISRGKTVRFRECIQPSFHRKTFTSTFSSKSKERTELGTDLVASGGSVASIGSLPCCWPVVSSPWFHVLLDLIAFDQIASKSTVILQHIPHNIRFWEVLLRIFDEVVPWMSWASLTRAQNDRSVILMEKNTRDAL